MLGPRLGYRLLLQLALVELGKAQQERDRARETARERMGLPRTITREDFA